MPGLRMSIPQWEGRHGEWKQACPGRERADGGKGAEKMVTIAHVLRTQG